MIPQRVDLLVFWDHNTRSDAGVQRDLNAIVETVNAGRPPAEATLETGTFLTLTIDETGRVPQLRSPFDREIPADLWYQFIEAQPRAAPDPAIFPPDRPVDLQRWTTRWRGRKTATPRLLMDIHDVRADGQFATFMNLPPNSLDPVAEVGVSTIDPTHLPVVLDWPSPFGALLMGGASLDALVEWWSMRQVVSLARDDPDAAHAKARGRLAVWSRSCSLRRWGLWLHAIQGVGLEAFLTELEARYGIVASTIDELIQHPEAQERAAERVPGTIYFGLLGYLWGQMVRTLEAGTLPRQCRHCSGLLPRDARANSVYCKDATCRRERARLRQQARRRGRRSQVASQDR